MKGGETGYAYKSRCLGGSGEVRQKRSQAKGKWQKRNVAAGKFGRREVAEGKFCRRELC